MKVKVLQSYPINCGNELYETGAEFELNDKEATLFIAQGRVTEVKSLKTNDNGGEAKPAPLSSQERQDKIRAAISELMAANPNDKPKCPDIVSKTGIKDVSGAERDALWEELKSAQSAKSQEGN
jgi:hypothetical protein|nr:MAG TPA: hypothetical protein [Caudoviricetes sp.]